MCGASHEPGTQGRRTVRAMSWEITLVHGNEDVMEASVDDWPAALDWLSAEEVRRGHSVERLQATFTLGSPEAGRVQYGTDYHYVKFWEVRP